LEAVKLLLNTLPLEDQRRVLDLLKAAIQPIATPRAGEVLGEIVRWIPRDSIWTVDEAKQGISEKGVSASPKEVYNALAYLTRKGHVRRIGYGRYIVDGAEVVTSDDLGVEPARYED
jgi:predicted transcriptional regulator of viral defense system